MTGKRTNGKKERNAHKLNKVRAHGREKDWVKGEKSARQNRNE